MLASASTDNSIRLWNATTGTEIRAFNGHTHFVYSVAFSPDDQSLASSCHVGPVCIWNMSTGTIHKKLGQLSGAADSVCFSPDGNEVATSTSDEMIRVWNVSARDGTDPSIVIPGHGRNWRDRTCGTGCRSAIEGAARSRQHAAVLPSDCRPRENCRTCGYCDTRCAP